MSDINTLINRLHELSRAVAERQMHEFDMHIPARPDRDADCVLQDAAIELTRLREQVAWRPLKEFDGDPNALFEIYRYSNSLGGHPDVGFAKGDEIPELARLKNFGWSHYRPFTAPEADNDVT